MTTQLIEAARLALEAIKLAKSSHNMMLTSDPPQSAWRYHNVDMKLSESIATLRAALEEPTRSQKLRDAGITRRPKGWSKDGDESAIETAVRQAIDEFGAERFAKALAEQPAQDEPVAWLHPSNATCVTTNPTAYARGIPLYTRPANSMNSTESSKMLDAQVRDVERSSTERKETFLQPLTDEQIETLWHGTSPYYDHQDFARAIEQAHGIKGEA